MKDTNNQSKSCCENTEKTGSKSILSGVVYGLTPHIGCIAFIIFSVLGVTTATALFKPLLLNPYFFYILIALSLAFATLSAFLYLKKHGIFSYNKTPEGNALTFSTDGIKKKWKYLSMLYGTTISTNLLLFMVIFPIVANINSAPSALALAETQSSVKLQVDIPCSGHAPLITEELKKIDGVSSVKFLFPSQFDVSYDPAKTSKQQILLLDVFNTYKATVISESSQTNGIQSTNSYESNPNIGGCGCGSGCGASGGCGCKST